MTLGKPPANPVPIAQMGKERQTRGALGSRSSLDSGLDRIRSLEPRLPSQLSYLTNGEAWGGTARGISTPLPDSTTPSPGRALTWRAGWDAPAAPDPQLRAP